MTAQSIHNNEERLGQILAAAIRGQSRETSCPGDNELALLLDGRTTRDQTDHLYRHFAGCPRCYRTFLAARSLDYVSSCQSRRLFTWPRAAMGMAALLVLCLATVLTYEEPQQQITLQQTPTAPILTNRQAKSAPATALDSSAPPVYQATRKVIPSRQESPGTGVSTTRSAPMDEAVQLVAKAGGEEHLLRSLRQATPATEPGFSSGFVDTGTGIPPAARLARTLGSHLLLLRFALDRGLKDDAERMGGIIETELRRLEIPTAADLLASSRKSGDLGALAKVTLGMESYLDTTLRPYYTLGWWSEAVVNATMTRQEAFFGSSVFSNTLKELQAVTFPPEVGELLTEIRDAAQSPLAADSYQRIRTAAAELGRLR